MISGDAVEGVAKLKDETDGIDRLKLRLVESRTVGPDGVHIQVYARAE